MTAGNFAILNSLTLKNFVVLKLRYFFMLKSVLSQISLDRMNDRKRQKNLTILGVLINLLLGTSELHSPFFSRGALRMGL